MSDLIYTYINPSYYVRQMYHVNMISSEGHYHEICSFAMTLKSLIRIEVSRELGPYIIDIVLGEEKDVMWFQLKYSQSNANGMFL